MQKTVFEFPHSIDELGVDDTLFAQAYAETAAPHRALLKTCIARLYDWYGGGSRRGGRVERSWRGGFDSLHAFQPVDFCVVLCDAAMESPARLLAAVVPALTSGIANVLVVRHGDGVWPSSLLTALELAGHDQVVDMSSDQISALLDELATGSASGLIIDMTASETDLVRLHPLPSRISVFSPVFEKNIAIWMDTDTPIDLDALAFAQPDVSCVVAGAEGFFPSEKFTYIGNDFNTFLAAIEDVVFVPQPLVNDVLMRSRIVLGPGHEGCWMWPDLRPEQFHIHRTAWTIGA
ncbi:hypothetical protein GO013_10010 [Pseudodesulfovibrio sp. JC047]|uniref:hypothetical protein n=1 Tax=Pseudodesulfovibrio sp. JC047 TaxID=2683199 RepID=UPI0013D6EB63|nr:hypothetical protein [Pseudodesulfovibrio sp. JC047]NDV19753.1 hypothetical protein [Pseudodesulfovibrio sp. JC047]